MYIVKIYLRKTAFIHCGVFIDEYNSTALNKIKQQSADLEVFALDANHSLGTGHKTDEPADISQKPPPEPSEASLPGF